MKQKWWNHGFQRKLTIWVCGISILLVFVISYLNYRWYSKQVVSQTRNQTQQIIEQLGTNIDSYIDELYRLTLSPYYNDQILLELEELKKAYARKLSYKRDIENFLSSVMTLPRDEILRVYILTDNEIFSYTRTPYNMQEYNYYKETSWYQKALQSKRPILIPIHAEKTFGNEKTTIISVARRIRSKEDNSKVLGVVKVDADQSVIRSLGDKVDFEHSGALYMISESGDVIYRKENGVALNLKEMLDGSFDRDYVSSDSGEKYICNYVKLKESGITILECNSYDDIKYSALLSIRKSLIWVLVSMLTALGILLFMIRRFLVPLYQVTSAMRRVQTGDLTVRVGIKRKDEIGYLADSFDTMIHDLNQVMKKNTELAYQVYEAEYRHKASQYEALCSQIKPHFIHNTLNTISILVKCGEYQKAVGCIENLSLFLRGVSQIEKDISLETEMKLVQSYLSICQLRYEERLTYQIEIPEVFLQVRIPALSIQPIVENSIKHGCEKRRDGIHIQISAKIEQEVLYLTVADNGIGISTEILLNLQEKMQAEENFFESKNESIDESIGLINVHRRLVLKFGIGYGLQISSDTGGTKVDIVMPIQMGENHV